MREISLPLPVLLENVGNNRKTQNYKVVSFQWDIVDELAKDSDPTSISLARISRLKKWIESYDKAWDLIQIFAPLENSEFIRVLYRKKE